jgi:threonine/homoserine/homoserine lactone efflux protein
MDLAFFLGGVVVISLSGVMAPGPVTAAAIAAGARARHAGALIAAGHGIVEFPLILLIVAGMGRIFSSAGVQTVIGFAGGVFLLLMAVQMLRLIGTLSDPAKSIADKGPVVTGIILSAGNPYFLLWWATVGLALATRAQKLGILAFVLFAAVHWLCDLGWLEMLSWASFKGARLLSERSQRIILAACAVALLVFAGIFIAAAGKNLAGLLAG